MPCSFEDSVWRSGPDQKFLEVQTGPPDTVLKSLKVRTSRNLYRVSQKSRTIWSHNNFILKKNQVCRLEDILFNYDSSLTYLINKLFNCAHVRNEMIYHGEKLEKLGWCATSGTPSVYSFLTILLACSVAQLV